MRDPFTKAPEKRLSDYNVAGASKTAIVIDCDQYDIQWWAHHIGVVSASEAKTFLTDKGERRGGKMPKTYMYQLVTERITRSPKNTRCTLEMERGTNLEPKGRDWYSIEIGNPVVEVGFVMDVGRRWGASPDGLLHDRGLEIKCRTNEIHLAAILDAKPPDDDLLQVQFGMWTCGLPGWDLCYYTPEQAIPSRIWTIAANPVLHANFAVNVPAFCDEVDAIEARLRGMV